MLGLVRLSVYVFLVVPFFAVTTSEVPLLTEAEASNEDVAPVETFTVWIFSVARFTCHDSEKFKAPVALLAIAVESSAWQNRSASHRVRLNKSAAALLDELELELELGSSELELELEGVGVLLCEISR